MRALGSTHVTPAGNAERAGHWGAQGTLFLMRMGGAAYTCRKGFVVCEEVVFWLLFKV